MKFLKNEALKNIIWMIVLVHVYNYWELQIQIFKNLIYFLFIVSIFKICMYYFVFTVSILLVKSTKDRHEIEWNQKIIFIVKFL